MSLLSIFILIFLAMEIANVATLYFAPGSKYANAVGIFNAWDKSKADPEVHGLIRYLTFWVAGTKLIFIALLLVIVITGDSATQWFAALAMVISIASFFWRLFPLIRKMDQNAQITPKNYSKVLGVMIACFMAMFSLALAFGWPF